MNYIIILCVFARERACVYVCVVVCVYNAYRKLKKQKQ